jgi:HTH-type transcriptional regulator/antitoxin HigA
MTKPAHQTPGDAIKAALAERGWTHEEFARIINKHRPEVTSLISGKRSITPEIAVILSQSLGNTPEYWLSLESSRQLSLIQVDAADVSRRVRAFAMAPVSEMEKRGWIKSGLADAELERELCGFFGINSLDDTPAICVATANLNPSDCPIASSQPSSQLPCASPG